MHVSINATATQTPKQTTHVFHTYGNTCPLRAGVTMWFVLREHDELFVNVASYLIGLDCIIVSSYCCFSHEQPQPHKVDIISSK